MTIHRTLLANLPQSRLRSLHRQAVESGDHKASMFIARFMLDRPMDTGCLFCNGAADYPVKGGIDFICSRCVVILSSAKATELRAGYEKAIRLNQPRKAKAISKFIDGDIEHEQTRTNRSNLVRTRPMRTTRPPRYEVRT